MRQRKVKNEAERLAALSGFAAGSGVVYKGRWREEFLARTGGAQKVGSPCLEAEAPPAPAERKLFLELGCGRGHFLAAHAADNPESFYVGAEGRSSIVLRAMELAEERALSNVLFITDYILRMEDFFEKGELSGIYLNFSDPWPKARHAKRRLTHRSYLQGYREALAPGGFIECKTDNPELFDFTLEECAIAGLTITECSRDLHKTDLSARLITTQYEHRFRLLGKPIHYCRMV